jgi:hypothetical protein
MFLFLFIAPESSANSASEPETLQCTVYVIHAKKSVPVIDEKLKDMVPYFKKSFSRFNYFSLLSEISVILKKNVRQEKELPNKEKIGFKYTGITKEKNLHKLYVDIGDLKFKVRLKDGGLFFQAGHSYEKGILILAFRVKIV